MIIGLTVCSPYCAAYGASSKAVSLSCKNLFRAPEKEKSKKYLTSNVREKISEVTKDASSVTLAAPQDKIQNVHPWAADAFKVYRKARVANERFAPEQIRFLNQLKPTAAKDGRSRIDHFKIILPADLAYSVFAYLIASHEFEHRIQLMKYGSLGLDENFIRFFMTIDTFYIEAEAIRAEWEFANALSPAAGEALAQIAGNPTIHPQLAIMGDARKFSLQKYLNYNYKQKRYDSESADRIAAQVLEGIREQMKQVPVEGLAGFIGEWKVPRETLHRPLAFYEQALSSVFPGNFKVELIPQSDAVVVLKVSKQPN